MSSDTPDVDLVSHTPESTVVLKGDSVSKNSDSKSKKKKNRYYDWTHYAKFTEAQWLAAQEGDLPPKETFVTLTLGAFLLAMHRVHNQEIGLVPSDFNGKYGKLVKEMLVFFEERTGSELESFRMALKWIRHFVGQGSTSFVGRANWPIQMAFSRDMYRDFEPNVLKNAKIVSTPEERAALKTRVSFPNAQIEKLFET